MYFELEGSLRIEKPFDLHNFRFQKTNAGQSVMYDFQVLNQEDADRQARAINAKLVSGLYSWCFIDLTVHPGTHAVGIKLYPLRSWCRYTFAS